MEIFCYGQRGLIRLPLHVKFFLGAAKTVVTGGKNAQKWPKSAQAQTIPLRGHCTNKIGGIQFLNEVMNCKKRFFGDFEVSP